MAVSRYAKIFAFMASALAGSAASAEEYRFLMSWDQSYQAYEPQVVPFLKNVEEFSNGSIKLSMSGPETVPPFEQLEPVAAGAFQFLFTHGAYHFGTTPLGTVIEALQTDEATFRGAGIKEYLDAEYQKLGLKLVGLGVSPPNIAYNLILREPVGEIGDLTGRKIRLVPSYQGVVDLLGGSTVTLPPAEIYTGLDKGIVDGTAWPSVGAYNYKWYEVAKYIMQPRFGMGSQMWFVNLNTWNSFTPEQQDAVLRAAAVAERSFHDEYVAMVEAEDARLKEMGMSFSAVSDDKAAEVQQAWNSGLWKMAVDKNAAVTEAFRTFVSDKGLSAK